MTESNLNVLLVTCFTIFALGATIASGQQPPPSPPPPSPPPQPQPQPQARRHIAKPGDVLPESDPLSPYSPRPQVYQQQQQWRPATAPAYAPQYAQQKPELLFKHELFNHPEFKQLLLSKPELLKPELSHLLLAHMQQFYQKLAPLKPQFAPQQSPYAPLPLNKYNSQPPPQLPKHLLEAELLKHKVEALKPDLTNFFNSINKPHLLSPALPAPQPQPPLGQSTPLNEVPQLFVPIPAVQQPEPAQPAPQPTLLPGFEFLNNLPQLPSFTLPQLPTFDTSCLLFGNCSFGTLSQPQNPFLRLPPQQPGQLPPQFGQLPQQPGQPPLQPGQLPLQPGQLPGQPQLPAQLQPVPARSVPAGQEGLVVEEQKRANLLAGGGELPPEQAIGACLAKPREPLACATSPSDWDEIYEQPIDCPLSTPRVWKCHCGFFKVESGQPQGPPTSAGQPAAAGQPTFSLPGLPGLSPSGQLVPAPAPPA